MERRNDDRIPCNAQARIWALGEHGSAGAVILNISGRGARLRVDREYDVSTTVRIEAGGGVLLGEVCYCRKEDSGFSIGIALSHSVVQMTNVGSLMEHLVEHSTAEALPEESVSGVPGAVKRT